MKHKTLLLLICLLMVSIAFPKTISCGSNATRACCKKAAGKNKIKLASAECFDVFPFTWYTFMN